MSALPSIPRRVDLGAVAKTHGRVAVLCEAQPEYLPLIARRIAEAPGYQPALGGLR